MGTDARAACLPQGLMSSRTSILLVHPLWLVAAALAAIPAFMVSDEASCDL